MTNTAETRRIESGLVEEYRADNLRLRARVQELEDACRAGLNWIEGDEATHGRRYGTGNILRAALAGEKP